MPEPRVLKNVFTILVLLISVHLSAQSPVALYESGREAQNSGNYFKAVELFRSALEENPNYVDALTGMGEAFFSLGEYADGLLFVERGITLDRSNYYLRSLKGRMLIGLRRFDEAREVFTAVIDEVPNQQDARFGLAELDIAFGKVKNAIYRYEEALKKLPNNRRALLSLVLLYDALEENDVSEEYIKAALRYHPAEPSVRYVAGKHYLSNGMYEEAEYHVRLSLNLYPGDRKTLHLLSQIYLEQEKYTETIALLEEMVSEQRDNPDLWYTLGVTYGIAGRTRDAIVALNRVFRLQSDNEMARAAMEDILLNSTDMEDPLREDAARFHFEKARELEDKFLLNEALFQYRKGLLLNPFSIDGRMGYARIYKLKGYPAKYLSELRILREEGADSIDILDEVEIQESLQLEGVAVSWGVDQFLLEPKKMRILTAYDPSSSEAVHFNTHPIMTRYLRNAVSAVSSIDVLEEGIVEGDFSTVFREAREQMADYFIVLSIIEKERSFAIKGNVHISSTGRQVDSFAVYRTGNDRIANTARRVSEYLKDVFPVQGTLLERRFGSGLADFGRYSGAEEDKEYLIVRQDRVDLAKDRIGLVWNEEDVLGSFTVTRTDEFVCEGTIEKKSFFDLINPGDLIVFPEERDQTAPRDTIPMDTLYREILTVP